MGINWTNCTRQQLVTYLLYNNVSLNEKGAFITWNERNNVCIFSFVADNVTEISACGDGYHTYQLPEHATAMLHEVYGPYLKGE